MNVVDSLDPLEIYLNISSIARGIIPLYGSIQLYLNPSIVYVFPVPV